MHRFLIARIAQGLLVILGALLIGFILTSVIGNPIEALSGGRIPPDVVALVAAERGYDRPILEQFGEYVLGALQGDFGNSYRNPGESAMTQVGQALPYTGILVLSTMVFSSLVAIPIAIAAVLRRDGWVDTALRRTLMVLQGVPQFFAGLVLVLVFAISLSWLPSIGVDSGVWSYVLPVLALSLPLLSTLARLLRAEMIDAMTGEFVAAMRARGLSYREIVLHHALRNAMPAVVTYLGLQLGELVAGTVLVEAVFAIPGLGSLTLTATDTRDLPVLQAVIITVAVAYVAANLLADLAVRALDPRVRETTA